MEATLVKTLDNHNVPMGDQRRVYKLSQPINLGHRMSSDYILMWLMDGTFMRILDCDETGNQLYNADIATHRNPYAVTFEDSIRQIGYEPK